MLYATIPPYVRHRRELAGHPSVGALRFNTIMPIGEDRGDVLDGLLEAAGGKPLWLDLKTRQLRITGFAYLPYAFVEVSHRLSVDLPARVLFKDCVSEVVRIVDGDRLILSERPERVVGAGEPVNILDPSLAIEGFLTETDREYIAAARERGLHRYMLSFVEAAADIEEVLALDPEAELIAKIESRRGLRYVEREYSPASGVRLMAARDDLYINMGDDKHEIFDALELILDRDPEAIAASRILTSLERDEAVSMGDLSDIWMLRKMGYRAFLLSDGLCFHRAAFEKAIALWSGLERALGA